MPTCSPPPVVHTRVRNQGVVVVHDDREQETEKGDPAPWFLTGPKAITLPSNKLNPFTKEWQGFCGFCNLWVLYIVLGRSSLLFPKLTSSLQSPSPLPAEQTVPLSPAAWVKGGHCPIGARGQKGTRLPLLQHLLEFLLGRRRQAARVVRAPFFSDPVRVRCWDAGLRHLPFVLNFAPLPRKCQSLGRCTFLPSLSAFTCMQSGGGIYLKNGSAVLIVASPATFQHDRWD